MGWFKKKSKSQILQKKYDRLMKEAFDLSKIDRKKADAKTAEAEAIMDQILALDEK